MDVGGHHSSDFADPIQFFAVVEPGVGKPVGNMTTMANEFGY
jgi:hypothetical protein